jgi:acyl carrier protein
LDSNLFAAFTMQLRRITSEASGLPIEKVQLESRLIEDLNMDSLVLTEFFMRVEDEFSVTMEDDAGRNVFIGGIKTLADVADAVVAQWGSGAAPRPEWLGEAPAIVRFETEPFMQLGGILKAGIAGEDLLKPIGRNREGFIQYQRMSDGMRCIVIPGDIVAIGSCEEDALLDQQPQHAVNLSSFLVDTEPVSNQAYARFLNSIGSIPVEIQLQWIGVNKGDKRVEHVQLQQQAGVWIPAAGTEDHPVILVSWFGANAYSLWANGLDWRYYNGDGSVSQNLRDVPIDYPAPADGTLFSMLPSEAQWEYAARGKNFAPFPWGHDLPETEVADLARHRIGMDYERDGLPTVPVNARLGMSPFGLHHMAGNVWQWCRDWYYPAFYTKAEASAPDAQNGDVTGVRSERGGSWVGPAYLAKSSYRRGRIPSARGRCLGFRCISVLPRSAIESEDLRSQI